MIKVNRLVKRFGAVVAVNDISFSVERGEIVGFLGPNGAGKTTTMRILTCFLPPSGGQASVAGYDVVEQSLDVRRRVGYLPENVPMYPEMRVAEYLHFRAKLKDVPRRERRSRVDYVMERCNVKHMGRRLIGTLSKGYRQRVGLADALVHDPEILVLDEPTVGLDPNQIRDARKLIAELGTQHTILLSTHILFEVEMVCSRVIIIDSGRIALTSALANLQRDAIITLEVRGPAREVQGVLETTDGVTEVKSRSGGDGIAGFEIRTRDDADLREAISKRVANNGWTIRQIDLRRRTLEDHFVAATIGAHRADGFGPAA
jgi:ABC-2 type transport system ATP-binding protein